MEWDSKSFARLYTTKKQTSKLVRAIYVPSLSRSEFFRQEKLGKGIHNFLDQCGFLLDIMSLDLGSIRTSVSGAPILLGVLRALAFIGAAVLVALRAGRIVLAHG